MQYGICKLSIVPVRSEANDASEMVTQLLYGDHFKIIEERKKWVRIRIAFDHYEGWIDKKQAKFITEEIYETCHNDAAYSADLIDIVNLNEQQVLSICAGSNVAASQILNHHFEGRFQTGQNFMRSQLLDTAMLYLNAPYLWGGKTPFGIDCSGLTQMVYKTNGIMLHRDASQQALQGQTLSFIEETQIGDLAFFDNQEGNIIHVEIMMGDNYIIHAHGKVRVDRIDHTGIFNVDTRTYSHQLRVLKTYAN